MKYTDRYGKSWTFELNYEIIPVEGGFLINIIDSQKLHNPLYDGDSIILRFDLRDGIYCLYEIDATNYNKMYYEINMEVNGHLNQK